MGLVKFGSQTLNIPEAPDGHILIAESEVNSLKAVKNDHLILKSKIPAGIPESEIATLVEKGSRFDAINTELNTAKGQVTQLQTDLKKFDNMPKDFSVDKWKADRTRESDEIWQGKIDVLTKDVMTEVEKEFGQKFEIDMRFIDPAKLEIFDPDGKDSKKEWRQLLDEAHTAQENFIRSKIEGTPAQPKKGPDGKVIQQPPAEPVVGPQGIRVPGL